VRNEEWIATLPSGKNVRYTYKEMTETLASISAQVEGSAVVYMHNNVLAPMTHQQVEAEFAHDVAMR